MATSADKSHSTMWARFHSESASRVVKLLRKSKSMDTLLQSTNWILKDIPDYDIVETLLPSSLPMAPLTKWEVLLHQHGEDHFLESRRKLTTSSSCPSLVYRLEASVCEVHSVVQSRSEEIPSVTNQPEAVSCEETNQLADLNAFTMESVQRTDDDSKMPDQNDEFFSWALERAERANIKDRGFEEFVVEEKEGLILENDYLSPTVPVGKLVTQRTNAGPAAMEETPTGINDFHSEYFATMKEPECKEMVPGVNTKCDNVEMDQAFQKMEPAAEPEHLAQIESMESFEYSFTKSKRKSYYAEEEMKLVVKDKAEIECKSQQTKFSREHYQGLDEDIKYSEELFDELNDDDDSTNLETRTMLCLPFLCWRRRNKHEKEQKGPNFFER
ncbi:uncharacterized protein LOC129712142 isoform X1 [Leucoraja erinacea]|uniref:uncharacterized protein LOC129712142 isoform X1 n=2 Tax=Leucoraja erinaceus TaxID=7782 RepID=UPI0024571A38|nr:uncharacterized protein LOC129712142 isoform X1 [Leucoraja erinacea]